MSPEPSRPPDIPAHGDVREIAHDGFDHVLANPPYLERGRASLSPNPIKALANVEGEAGLADWVAAAIRAVRPGGTVTFIHRADRAVELRRLMASGLGDLVQCALLPREGGAPKRVLVQGVEGGRPGLRETPPLILHDGDGGYTPRAEAILRDAAPFPLVA